jgi:hypothetical protein
MHNFLPPGYMPGLSSALSSGLALAPITGDYPSSACMWSREQSIASNKIASAFQGIGTRSLSYCLIDTQKLGVILCRLLLLFSKPQNGAEILFDPFSAAGYDLQFVVRFLASGPGGALLTRTT